MPVSRDLSLLASRAVLGGYLIVHGAQKAFGAFGGPGIEKAAMGFEMWGLKPGKTYAQIAAVSEMAGGALTVLGAAEPIGPAVIAGTMAVATAATRSKGPLAARGGYELAAGNLGAALSLVASGYGRLSVDTLIGRRPPRAVVRLVLFGAVVVTAATLLKVLGKKAPAPAPAPAAATA